MRLISWNISIRTDCTQHINALHERKPDVVALQEVNPNSLSGLRDKLHQIGLNNVIDNASIASQFGRKHYFALIASRWPLSLLSHPVFEVPFPESVLSAVISHPKFEIEMHTVHVPPGSSRGWVKVETFEGIYNRLAREPDLPRILCGDFNSPRLELPNGQVITWAQTEKGNLQKDRGERWDAGERSCIEGLKHYDLPDVFRLLHGYDVQDFSLQMKNKSKITRRRSDHVFASSALKPVVCRYLHSLRDQGLSDHSPLEVDFDFEK